MILYSSDDLPCLQSPRSRERRSRPGKLPPGSGLPSITRLQKEHGLAMGTVPKAIQLLVDEGLRRRRARMGMVVVPSGERWA